MSALIINKNLGEREMPVSRWKKLQSIWQDIEKKQQRNHRYEKKIMAFFCQFQTQLSSTEAEVCLQTERFVHHLISFIPKRNIKKEEFDALLEWIEDQIQNLENNPFSQNDINSLRNKFHDAKMLHRKNQIQNINLYQQTLDEVRPRFIQMMAELLDEEYVPEDNELKAFLDNPDAFIAFLKSKILQQDDAFTNEGSGTEHDFYDDPECNADEQKSELKDPLNNFFDTKTMAKLYRQLAKQFHPDKEFEVSQKEQKNKLMQELSQAKKEKDTFAMLSMAQVWLPNFELNVDKSTLSSLEITLQSKITTLNQKYKYMQNSPDISGYVWREFGGGSKVRQQKKLSQYRQQLITDNENLHSLCLSLKTMKSMRAQLRERMEKTQFFNMMQEMYYVDE